MNPNNFPDDLDKDYRKRKSGDKDDIEGLTSKVQKIEKNAPEQTEIDKEMEELEAEIAQIEAENQKLQTEIDDMNEWIATHHQHKDLTDLDPADREYINKLVAHLTKECDSFVIMNQIHLQAYAILLSTHLTADQFKEKLKKAEEEFDSEACLNMILDAFFASKPIDSKSTDSKPTDSKSTDSKPTGS